jgi:hypothetical protein
MESLLLQGMSKKDIKVLAELEKMIRLKIRYPSKIK